MSLEKTLESWSKKLSPETVGVLVFFFLSIWLFQRYCWERALKLAEEYSQSSIFLKTYIWIVPAILIILISACVVYFIAEIIDAYREKRRKRKKHTRKTKD